MEDNNIEQQNSQEDLSPEEAKAALGIVTYLQQQHLDSQAMPEEPTSPGNEPGTEEQPAPQEDVKAEIQGLETRILDELKTLREDMKTQGDAKSELADLKKQIEEVINESE